MTSQARAKSSRTIDSRGARVTVAACATSVMRKINRAVGDTRGVELQSGAARVRLPAEIVDLLRLVTDAAIAGDAVTVSVMAAGDTGAELTSQQTADLLNVSRPHIVKLAREGVLPYRMVGNRHRFLASDVLAYRERETARRSKVLAELAPKHGYGSEDF